MEDFSLTIRVCEFSCFLYSFLEGSPSPEPGKICGTLNPSKRAKWESLECNKKLGYICKKGNATLNSFTVPSGKQVITIKTFGSGAIRTKELLKFRCISESFQKLGMNLA